tara:strand:- start:6173 stop:6691 length:519 start_codon:yes stop_codon:yes gene_type:complete
MGLSQRIRKLLRPSLIGVDNRNLDPLKIEGQFTRSYSWVQALWRNHLIPVQANRGGYLLTYKPDVSDMARFRVSATTAAGATTLVTMSKLCHYWNVQLTGGTPLLRVSNSAGENLGEMVPDVVGYDNAHTLTYFCYHFWATTQYIEIINSSGSVSMSHRVNGFRIEPDASDE